MEQQGGISRAYLMGGDSGFVSNVPTLPLKRFGRPAGDDKQWWAPGLRDGSWHDVSIGERPESAADNSLLTWYRMRFSLPSPRPDIWVPWRLHLVATGNGFLYLNGHPLGRYWDIGPQHDFFLPECWLKFGNGSTNVLALNLRPTATGAWIQSAAVEPYSEFAEMR